MRVTPDGDQPLEEDAGISTRLVDHRLLSAFVVIWGVNFVLAETALRSVKPIAFSAARYLIGAVVAVAFLMMLRRRRTLTSKLSLGEWLQVTVAAAAGGVLAPWLGIEGLNLTHAGRAAVWVAAGPVFSLILGRMLGTETISRSARTGIFLAVTGAALLAGDGMFAGQGAGDLLLSSAVLLSASELHLLRRLIRTYSALEIAVRRTVIAALLYGLVALPWIVETSWLRIGPAAWAALLVGGALAIGVGQWVQARAVGSLGPTHVSTVYLGVPVVALIGGWIMLSNPPSVSEMVATGAILAGVYILGRVRRSSGRGNQGASDQRSA